MNSTIESHNHKASSEVQMTHDFLLSKRKHTHLNIVPHSLDKPSSNRRNLDSINKQLKRETPQKTYSCYYESTCKDKFNNLADLKKHLVYKHEKGDKNRCKLCNSYFSKLIYLHKHTKTCENKHKRFSAELALSIEETEEEVLELEEYEDKESIINTEVESIIDNLDNFDFKNTINEQTNPGLLKYANIQEREALFQYFINNANTMNFFPSNKSTMSMILEVVSSAMKEEAYKEKTPQIMENLSVEVVNFISFLHEITLLERINEYNNWN